MMEQYLFDVGPRVHQDRFDFGANADITKNRHKGAEASVEANPDAGKKIRDQRTILSFMKCRGGKSYLKEIVRGTGIAVQSASARISELKASGEVEAVKGERAEKCGVIQIAK